MVMGEGWFCGALPAWVLAGAGWRDEARLSGAARYAAAG